MHGYFSEDNKTDLPNSNETYSEEDIQLGMEVIQLLYEWSKEFDNKQNFQEIAS